MRTSCCSHAGSRALFGAACASEPTEKQQERVAQLKAMREAKEPEVLSGPGWYGNLQRFHDTQAIPAPRR
jgi:hypothetical protein